MHSLSLLLGSILGHEWSIKLVSECQRIVTYFRSATKPLHMLRNEARLFGVTTTLVSSCTTRFTSVHLCMESVMKLEPAFQALLRKERTIIANTQVPTMRLGYLSSIHRYLAS
jgi:hypothetical protein